MCLPGVDNSLELTHPIKFSNISIIKNPKNPICISLHNKKQKQLKYLRG